MRGAALVLAVGVLWPAPARAWGADGHEAIVRLASRRVENPCLAGFLTAKLGTLLIESMAPDRWKETDPLEGPRHYLDIDAAGDPAAYPRTFSDAVTRFGLARAVDNGTVPWRTEEMAASLAARLAERDPDAAARTAAHLGHYVGDAFSPLHATVNFDGQLTGNPGLHERWESRMPRQYRRLIEAAADAARAPAAEPDPVGGVFAALLSGNAAVPRIVAADRESGGAPAALYAATGDLVAERWAGAAALLAALWEDAWARAGRPILAGMPASCLDPSAPAASSPEPSGAPIVAAGGGGCAAAPGASEGWLFALSLFALRKGRRPRAGPQPS
jgi:hypothetical protein